MADRPTDNWLLEAKAVSLSIPVFQPEDRKLLTNPVRFITDLYLSKNSRQVAQLLRNISLRLEDGDRLGLIGLNGAGKSTLLKLLAGIYKPTVGVVTKRGLVKGLFSPTMGMNEEATGLENIYMRGLLMGFSLQQVRERVPSVIEFSGLEGAIERPINTYSSGMRTRLALGVLTMMQNPDVLLLDEWVGTGDAQFRSKAGNPVQQMVDGARAMVLATHNDALMKSSCTHGLVMHKGELVYSGVLNDALKYYHAEIAAPNDAQKKSAQKKSAQKKSAQ